MRAHPSVRLSRNISANFIGRGWGLLSVLLVTPAYARQLGLAAYGLVGLYATLLTMMAFADLGFTATLNRELARLSPLGAEAARRMGDTVRTVETLYTVVVPLMALALWSVAPFLADRWLNLGTLSRDEVVLAIRLMGTGIALQLPAGLFIGGLQGRQEQTTATAVQLVWGIGTAGLTLAAMHMLGATVVVFAAVQVLTNLLYVLVARWLLWRSVARHGPIGKSRFERDVLDGLWRYAAGMLAMALLSTALTQMDKLAISRLMSIREVGTYLLATTVATAPLMLATPIAAAVFPRLTGDVAGSDTAGISATYRLATQLVALAIAPVSAVLVVFMTPFVLAWTGSADTAAAVSPSARFLVCGQLLQALTLVPYYLGLAHGSVRMNLTVGAVSLLLLTPLLIVGVPRFGLEGAAGSWLLMNAIVMPAFMRLLHRRLAEDEWTPWVTRAVLLPCAVAFVTAATLRFLLPSPVTRITALVVLACSGLCTLAVTALTLPIVTAFIGQKRQSWRALHG